ncbi:hypothetical protein KIW84_061703 [Lathyrus oleraceus]|uniref:Uncharacterized protein n=1 Tax=Pisum sativum TaxID=3888 RepID=A0A9D4W4H8_PEA|nr:hypothetical protein KIW84_061703 [Pisum sativum]
MATSGKASKETIKAAKVSIKSTKVPQKISDFPPFTMLPGRVMRGNQQHIPEPKTEEQRKIYESQVLILVTVYGKTNALLVPLPDLNTDPNKLRDFFPTYQKCKPIELSKKHRASTTEEPQSSTDEPIDLR